MSFRAKWVAIMENGRIIETVTDKKRKRGMKNAYKINDRKRIPAQFHDDGIPFRMW